MICGVVATSISLESHTTQHAVHTPQPEILTSLLDIHHPDPWHAPVSASTVVNTPEDGRRKRPKHVE